MRLPFLPQSRLDLPDLFNLMGLLGVGAEIGTDRGEYAEHLRRHWRGNRLLCVDPWTDYCEQPSEERERAYRETLGRLEHSFPQESWSVMRTESREAARALFNSGLPKMLFDFVYLDGDHSYEGVIGDIESWWPLVRSGGVLCGHDWVSNGWRHYGDGPEHAYAQSPEDLLRPGWPCFVRRAVEDFFGASGLYVTSPLCDGGWQSWLVVKP